MFAAIALLAAVSACGGGDDPAPEPTVSIDEGPTDEEALETLVRQLWDARVATQNAGEVSRDAFVGILSTELIEQELSILQTYADEGLTRAGAPKIDQVEAEVDGDTAVVLACLNEDEWVATIPDQPDFEQTKLGTVVWGAEAARDGDNWIITAEIPNDDERKADKTC